MSRLSKEKAQQLLGTLLTIEPIRDALEHDDVKKLIEIISRISDFAGESALRKLQSCALDWRPTILQSLHDAGVEFGDMILTAEATNFSREVSTVYMLEQDDWDWMVFAHNDKLAKAVPHSLSYYYIYLDSVDAANALIGKLGLKTGLGGTKVIPRESSPYSFYFKVGEFEGIPLYTR